MDATAYQKKAIETIVFPDGDQAMNLMQAALGLGGETGEVLELIKRVRRDGVDCQSPEWLAKFTDEVGDVVWYLAVLCNYAGIELNMVLDRNIEKLNSRKVRGKLHGSGGDR